MPAETIIAVLGGITALVVAVTALIVQIQALRRDLDGRVTELVAHASAAARKEGELAGRDFMQRLHSTPGAPASALGEQP